MEKWQVRSGRWKSGRQGLEDGKVAGEVWKMEK